MSVKLTQAQGGDPVIVPAEGLWTPENALTPYVLTDPRPLWLLRDQDTQRAFASVTALIHDLVETQGRIVTLLERMVERKPWRE